MKDLSKYPTLQAVLALTDEDLTDKIFSTAGRIAEEIMNKARQQAAQIGNPEQEIRGDSEGIRMLQTYVAVTACRIVETKLLGGTHTDWFTVVDDK